MGQEFVPLFEGRELFEGERVDTAQLGELALSVGEPGALFCAVEALRLSVSVRARNRHVWAVLSDEHILNESQLLP